MSTRYTLGPDVGPEEELHDSCGTRIGEDYAERAVADAHDAAQPGRNGLAVPEYET